MFNHRKNIKHKIRRVFGRTLQILGYTSGLMRLTARFQSVEGAIILMYHSVADDQLRKFIDPANHVPADIFTRQMEFLSQQRKVVSLGELLVILQQGKSPPAELVVITFDDGYLDNLTIAAPILDRYELPATLFLPTSYIDRGETQWVDQAYTAFKFRSKPIFAMGTERATLFDLDDPGQNWAGYKTVCGELLKAGAQERQILLTELYDQLQPTAQPPRLTMTWDEVRTLLSRHRCFQIGGHTREHTDLTSVSEDKAKTELTTCARRIQDELGVRPRHFSFCYGRTSEFLRRLTTEAGFEAACGGGGLDPVIKAHADVFRLPRVAAPATMRRFDLLTSSANTGIWRRLGR
jgi:peptidoglycan/xylan/chitin deacetylase (PgdA/CDA1 family)